MQTPHKNVSGFETTTFSQWGSSATHFAILVPVLSHQSWGTPTFFAQRFDAKITQNSSIVGLKKWFYGIQTVQVGPV